jgi:hypothetical protein
MGDATSSHRMVFSRRLYRTIARLTSRPRSTEAVAAPKAMPRLSRKEYMISGRSNIREYHWSVSPFGGNTTYCVVVREPTVIATTGARKKTCMATT